MSIMAEDGGMGGFGPGPQGRMDTGDYVMSQRESSPQCGGVCAYDTQRGLIRCWSNSCKPQGRKVLCPLQMSS
jgi:hypothetical protein